MHTLSEDWGSPGEAKDGLSPLPGSSLTASRHILLLEIGRPIYPSIHQFSVTTHPTLWVAGVLESIMAVVGVTILG